MCVGQNACRRQYKNLSAAVYQCDDNIYAIEQAISLGKAALRQPRDCAQLYKELNKARSGHHHEQHAHEHHNEVLQV